MQLARGIVQWARKTGEITPCLAPSCVLGYVVLILGWLVLRRSIYTVERCAGGNARWTRPQAESFG